MSLLRHHPAPPLDAFVDCFWWSQRDMPDGTCEHMLPGGGVQLVFALHAAPLVSMAGASAAGAVVWSRGVVHGPQWRYFVAGPKPRGATLGVAFHPGAAAAILGMPVAEFTDRHVSLDDLWGARGRSLHERLLSAASPAAAFHLLECELLLRLQRPLLIHPAVAHALATGDHTRSRIRIAELHREAGYSSRHFIALFRAAVGLTPKHFYRVQRFKTVVRHLGGGDPVNLADVAAAAGYSDQAHLTREFRDFAGITPTQYRPRDRDSVMHHRVQPVLPAPAPGQKSSRRG